jgi:hypothetical protein
MERPRERALVLPDLLESLALLGLSELPVLVLVIS